MSLFDESDTFVDDMIRRVREGKLNSRDDRSAARRSGDLKEVWWNDASDKENTDENPRAAALIPNRQISNYREYSDRLSGVVNSKSRYKDDSDIEGTFDMRLSLDDIIAREIIELEKELKDPRELSLSNPRKSWDLTGSYDRLSPDKEMVLHEEIGYDNFTNPAISARNMFYKSDQTLKSSGVFRGLLSSELKLDGGLKYDADINLDEKGNKEVIQDLNTNLEALMTRLGGSAWGEGGGSMGIEKFNPSNEHRNILDVACKLQCDIQGHLAHFTEKYAEETAKEKEMKLRDEQMKEEGRREERNKMHLDLDIDEDWPFNSRMTSHSPWFSRSSHRSSKVPHIDHKLETRRSVPLVSGGGVSSDKVFVSSQNNSHQPQLHESTNGSNHQNGIVAVDTTVGVGGGGGSPCIF